MSDDSSTAKSGSINRQLVVEMAVVLCLGFVPHLVNALVWYGDEWSGTFAQDMITRISMSLQIVAPLLYILWRSGDAWSVFGIRKPDYLADGVTALIVFGLANVVCYWTSAFVSYHDRISVPPNESAALYPGGIVDYGLLVVAMLCNALAEELVMRAYLITRLRQLGANVFLAIVVSTALFAAYHIYQGLPAVITIAMFGLIMGGVFAITNRLWPLVVAHAVYSLYLYS